MGEGAREETGYLGSLIRLVSEERQACFKDFEGKLVSSQ